MRYWLTVDWCNENKRGIFCDRQGSGFWKDDEPHTNKEMVDILGAFFIILSPKSEPHNEVELKQFNRYRSLAEYTHQYGIAQKENKLVEVSNGE